jgi:hypothetical protein
MKILESYLNDYKQETLRQERKNISNIMLKYIVVSCFPKMYRRAFHWASLNIIGSLTEISWDNVPPFPTVPIGTDEKLSSILKIPGDIPGSTMWEWLVSFYPSERLGSFPSLDKFLTLTSSTSGYQFDQDIGIVFHSLLLSSLYAYLCVIRQLKFSMDEADQNKIRKYVGQFCNVIRIFYFVSHSNAMRAYFTHGTLSMNRPTFRGTFHYKHSINAIIQTRLVSLGWGEEKFAHVSNGGDEGDPIGEDKEDPEDNYIEAFKDAELQLVYRKALMSFVDHYTALRLLERRSTRLPLDETIKLSLIAIKHEKLRYRSWEEMEKVVEKMCQAFGSKRDDSQRMIKKVKKYIEKESSQTTDVIRAFKAIMTGNSNTSKRPEFHGCIHCESSLAAILCQLHDTPDLNSDLRELFEASPSSHSSSFTL